MTGSRSASPAALDPVNTRLIKDVLRELVAAGRTVIMSTHQPSYRVAQFAVALPTLDNIFVRVAAGEKPTQEVNP
ncbi:hypothetical protein [Candidatus Chloroploca asiatica]|uniref:Uncharacterized protein n=1 Tax=Candidatus Chloroploca asiatica TaxID=1506545 RepID=A0A2H3KTA9_9CHLR|nr:hypothetical protein [Candidatus Chloroploca asiatica]NCC33553.1 hypothetical protein [Chloroflexia bacterium]PDW01017.1 hypothetical protein A9Q02_21315 [Candidatus Chloroploca asiatica]